MKVKGTLHMALSSVFFALSAVMVKLVSSEYNSVFVSVSRFVIGILLGFVVLLTTGKRFIINDKKSWALRGVTGSVSMLLFYLAIQMTNSGRATLMNNLYIIFVAIFGVVYLKEPIKKRNLVSMVLCLAGVSIVFYDGSKHSILGDAVGIISGLIMGLAIYYTKRSSENEHPVIVYLSACFIGLLFAPFAAVHTQQPSFLSILILLGIGISSFLAQLLMTSGYSSISAIKGGLISYLKIPATIIFSSLLGEEIGWKFYVGTVLLIAGLLVEELNLTKGKPAKRFELERRRDGIR